MLPHTLTGPLAHMRILQAAGQEGLWGPWRQAVQKVSCPTRGGRRSTRHPEAGGLDTSPRSRPCGTVAAGCWDPAWCPGREVTAGARGLIQATMDCSHRALRMSENQHVGPRGGISGVPGPVPQCLYSHTAARCLAVVSRPRRIMHEVPCPQQEVLTFSRCPEPVP